MVRKFIKDKKSIEPLADYYLGVKEKYQEQGMSKEVLRDIYEFVEVSNNVIKK